MWCIFTSKNRIWLHTSHSTIELILTRMGTEPWTSHRKLLLIFLIHFCFFHWLSSEVEGKLQAMKCYLLILYTGISLIFFLHCVFTDLYICIYFLLLPLQGYQVQLRKFRAGREVPGTDFIFFCVENFS